MNLRPLDVACFVSYVFLLVGVGVYFMRQQKGLKSYLLADQDIHWIIVAVSVLAALFSGITYLGAPTESYYNDLSYLWVVASFFLAVNYCVCCLALVTLRRREPGMERPFRAWGYPWSVGIVLAGAVAFLIGVLLGDTRTALVATGLLAAGLVGKQWLSRERRPIT